jgi:hypothetical protein
MKRFALYYKAQHRSHCRSYGTIKAENAVDAFKKAVRIITEKGIDPKKCKELYVIPVEPDRYKRYKQQCHGWDSVGSFPRF